MSTPSLRAYMSPEHVAALCKLAEGEHHGALKPMLAGMGGMAVGSLAGVGASHLANEAYKHFKGTPIPKKYILTAAPIIGGALGLAYNMAQAHQREAMRHDEAPDDKSKRRVP